MVISFKDSASVSLVPRRCRSIAEMLTERAMLEDVAPNNRVLAGAKNLLLKYALCNLVRQVAQEERNPGCQTCSHSLLQTQKGHNLGRNTWMEIAQKLVAVGVVSAVSGTNGFQWCFAFTMMMAATSSMVQPYAQPQARLHVLEPCSMDPGHGQTTFQWKFKLKFAKTFLLGEEFGRQFGQNSYKPMHSPGGLEALCCNFWAHPIPIHIGMDICYRCECGR